MNVIENHTLFIKNEAKRLGFIGCGISKAGFLDHEAPKLEQWLKNGYHGQMQYMENYFDKRLDPSLLVEGAKSVVSLLFNYYPEQKQTEDTFKIAKYAYGEDYHYVVKDKLKTLMHLIEENIGAVNGRVFVDSAPVLEKAWAVKSGLGWMGKHTNVLTKKTGSFYFLAELILDLDLIVDAPTTDHCGTCTACIDACPTEAIIAPYVLDASKCISYLTIELKENIPQHFKNQMDDWAFGCDVCQDVCPWNSFAKPHQEDRFKPQNDLLNFSKKEWTELTQEVFKKVFKKSAVNRTKFVGLKRNIEFLG
jgi:epoxyqueuosine reductase